MEENKKSDFTRIIKILKENSSSITFGFVFLWLFTFLSVMFFGALIIPNIIQDFSVFEFFFILLWFGFLSIVWYSLIKSKRLERQLLQHINNWTIIVKTPQITKFEFDSHSESWHIIVANDWWIEYKSSTISNCYYIQKVLPYSWVDPEYLNSMEYIKFKELKQQIKTLKNQCNYIDKKEQQKLNKEIEKLEKEKSQLSPQHLISRWISYKIWTEPTYTEYYIWDKINVFICPDNPKNYLMEI